MKLHQQKEEWDERSEHYPTAKICNFLGRACWCKLLACDFWVGLSDIHEYVLLMNYFSGWTFFWEWRQLLTFEELSIFLSIICTSLTAKYRNPNPITTTNTMDFTAVRYVALSILNDENNETNKVILSVIKFIHLLHLGCSW